MNFKVQKTRDTDWKVKKKGTEESKDYDPLKAFKRCKIKEREVQFGKVLWQ